MLKYRNIVFLDGEDTQEPFDIINNEGKDDVFEYLLKWDCGEVTNLYDTPPWGDDDYTSYHYDGGLIYVVSWNWNLSYFSLTEVIDG